MPPCPLIWTFSSFPCSSATRWSTTRLEGPQPHILTDTFFFLIRYLWTKDLDEGPIPSTDALGKAATHAIAASSR